MKLAIAPNPEMQLFSDLAESILTHSKVPVLILLSSELNDVYDYFLKNIDTFLQYAKELQLKDFSYLTFSHTDQKFYEENNDLALDFTHFKDNGLIEKFMLLGANFIEMNSSIENYNQKLKDIWDQNYKISLSSIGNKGQTLGIDIDEDEQKYLEKYPFPDLVAQIKNGNEVISTFTPFAIKQMNEALVYIKGNENKDVLSELLYGDKQEWELPAKIYKCIENAKIYTDISLL